MAGSLRYSIPITIPAMYFSMLLTLVATGKPAQLLDFSRYLPLSGSRAGRLHMLCNRYT